MTKDAVLLEVIILLRMVDCNHCSALEECKTQHSFVKWGCATIWPIKKTHTCVNKVFNFEIILRTCGPSMVCTKAKHVGPTYIAPYFRVIEFWTLYFKWMAHMKMHSFFENGFNLTYFGVAINNLPPKENYRELETIISKPIQIQFLLL